MDANPLVPPGIALRNLQGAVRAAIVDDDIFPGCIGLAEHTLNAFGKVLLAVIDRSDDTYKRLPEQNRSPFVLGFGRWATVVTLRVGFPSHGSAGRLCVSSQSVRYRSSAGRDPVSYGAWARELTLKRSEIHAAVDAQPAQQKEVSIRWIYSPVHRHGAVIPGSFHRRYLPLSIIAEGVRKGVKRLA